MTTTVELDSNQQQLHQQPTGPWTVGPPPDRGDKTDYLCILLCTPYMALLSDIEQGVHCISILHYHKGKLCWAQSEDKPVKGMGELVEAIAYAEINDADWVIDTLTRIGKTANEISAPRGDE